MKKVTILLGILALGLVFGFGLAGCSSDSSNGPAIDSKLVGKWALSATPSTLMYEFTSDGKINVGTSAAVMNYSAANGKISTSASGVALGTIDYEISSDGKTLTLKNPSTATVGLGATTYTKM